MLPNTLNEYALFQLDNCLENIGAKKSSKI